MRTEETRTITLTLEELGFVLDGLELLYHRLVKHAERQDPRQQKLIEQLKHCQITLQKLAMIKHRDVQQLSDHKLETL